jgi:hypothetical protein
MFHQLALLADWHVTHKVGTVHLRVAAALARWFGILKHEHPCRLHVYRQE